MSDDAHERQLTPAETLWNNDVIHARICQLADKADCALIARLDRRSFSAAIRILWSEWQGRPIDVDHAVRLQVAMDNVQCPADRQDRYKACAEAVRYLQLDRPSAGGIVPYLMRYPNIRSILAVNWLTDINIIRDATGSIKGVHCLIIRDTMQPIRMSIDTGIDLLQRALPSSFPRQIVIGGSFQAHRDHARATQGLAGSDRTCYECLYVTGCQTHEDCDSNALEALVDIDLYACTDVPPDYTGLLKGARPLHGLRRLALLSFDSSAPTLKIRSIRMKGAFNASWQSVVDHADIIRAVGNFRLIVDSSILSTTTIAHDQATFKCPPSCLRARPAKTITLHFDLDDSYDLLDDPNTRSARLLHNTSWLDMLAQVCLHVGGPSGTYQIAYAPPAPVDPNIFPLDTPDHVVEYDVEDRIQLHAQANATIDSTIKNLF